MKVNAKLILPILVLNALINYVAGGIGSSKCKIKNEKERAKILENLSSGLKNSRKMLAKSKRKMPFTI